MIPTQASIQLLQHHRTYETCQSSHDFLVEDIVFNVKTIRESHEMTVRSKP
jgi:hypothetical protein